MEDAEGALRRWLQAHGLEACTERLWAQGVDLAVLPLLSEADLLALGLTLGQRRMLQAGLRASPHAAGGAHRRQITVMFCDLVGSTELSARLDPEDLRTLLQAYYAAGSRWVEEAGGFISQVAGDGILAYFGYPEAREDAAESAVRTGLRIVDSTRRLLPPGEVPLAARVGIATGLSVIGELAGNTHSEHHAAFGQTPNLASRLQALAAPGCVVVSDATRRLAGGYFHYADQGVRVLKGLARPVHVWRVLSEAPFTGRYDAHHPQPAACLGRDAERAALLQAWAQAAQHGCQRVTLIGEAGIGKSCLLQALHRGIAAEAAHTVLLQCVPSRTATPWFPIVAWLRHDSGVDTAAPEEHAACLSRWLGDGATPLDRALLAELLALPAEPGAPRPALPPDRKRALIGELVVHHLARRLDDGRLLLLVEDVHWIDGASASLLATLFERLRDRSMLAVVTTRPDPPAPWREAGTLSLQLEPLQPEPARRLLHLSSGGRALPAPLEQAILSRAEGVPLFIEELTAAVLESGRWPEGASPGASGPELPLPEIPGTLRDSLAARLDRLGEARAVARVGSAIGREFDLALLAQVMRAPPARLRAQLQQLVQAQLLHRRGDGPDEGYVFKHALVQQAAYDSLLRSERQALHGQIVDAIETHQPGLARREPGLMAHHCQLAGRPDREIDYRVAAGQASTRLVAIPEALAHYARAAEAVATLPPTPRNARRHIEILLGTMEVGRFAILPSRLQAMSAQARTLAALPGVDCDPATMASILFQDARAHVYTSRYDAARRIFEEIRALGRAHATPAIERRPASAYTMCLCCQGRFGETLAFLHPGNIAEHKDSGSFIDYIAGLGWIAYASCQVGRVDDGLHWGDVSVAEAQAVHSPIYLAGAYVWRSHAHMAARQWDQAMADAQACVDLADAHRVPYLGWHGLVFLALCQCRAGLPQAATETLLRARRMLAQVDDGCWSLLDYLPAIESEIAWSLGHDDAACRHADEAIALAATLGGDFAEAMGWRSRALAALRRGDPLLDCEADLERALALQDQGGAQAERVATARLWARLLREAGHAEAAGHWADRAAAYARAYGHELRRGDHDDVHLTPDRGSGPPRHLGVGAAQARILSQH